MHARPSAAISKKAKEFLNTYIYIINPDNGEKHNARSILDVMSINKNGGDTVLVRTFGKNEKDASKAIINIIENFEIEDANK